jgi:outer membrane protein assembly factor BamD (BamD/ComL family)
LADSLIKEGSRCIEEGKLDDAIQLFEEAGHLEKWRDIYGSIIFANLAYICVMKRNYTKAMYHIEDYYQLSGSS